MLLRLGHDRVTKLMVMVSFADVRKEDGRRRSGWASRSLVPRAMRPICLEMAKTTVTVGVGMARDRQRPPIAQVRSLCSYIVHAAVTAELLRDSVEVLEEVIDGCHIVLGRVQHATVEDDL
uniref:Uncharacterized protein n=1 Tax=Oryza barthii TaxID=65489 RepID=A0A0D3GHP3_9ORYZ